MSAKIRVPQEDGELRIAIDGGEPRTWRVQDHLVTAADDAERDRLLLLIDGATVAEGDSVRKDPPETESLAAGRSQKDTPSRG